MAILGLLFLAAPVQAQDLPVDVWVAVEADPPLEALDGILGTTVDHNDGESKPCNPDDEVCQITCNKGFGDGSDTEINPGEPSVTIPAPYDGHQFSLLEDHLTICI